MHNINKTKREDEEVEEKAYTKQKLIEIPKPTIRSTKLINFLLCEFAKINKQITAVAARAEPTNLKKPYQIPLEKWMKVLEGLFCSDRSICV